MSENIPYIIAEDGYYYVAYKEKVKVPELVVSAKGVANGLSEEYNDGWDFGPDSYNPNSTASIPYTQTVGILESILYALDKEIGTIKLSAGVFDITNSPFTTDPVTGRKYKLYIPIVDQSTKDNMPQGLSIIGAGTPVPASYWNAYPTANYPGVTAIYDGTVDTTTTNTAQDFIFGVMGTPSTYAETPYNFIELYLDGLVFQVQSESKSYLGGVDTTCAMQASFGKISLRITQGQTNYLQPATGLIWIYDGGALPLNIADSIDVFGWQDGLISNFAHAHIGYFHASQCVYGMSNYGGDYLGGSSNYMGQIDIAEFENVANFLNLNTGPLSSKTSIVKLEIGLFGAGDLSEPSGMPLTYTSSIVSASSTYGNSVIIEKYDTGSSGTTPVFNIQNTHDNIWIRSWSTLDGGNGYYYLPATTTPTVPASGTAQQNTNQYSVDVYIYGGTVTEIQITKSGTAFTVFSNSSGVAMSGQSFKLNPTDSITLTYSTAPTWSWVPA